MKEEIKSIPYFSRDVYLNAKKGVFEAMTFEKLKTGVIKILETARDNSKAKKHKFSTKNADIVLGYLVSFEDCEVGEILMRSSKFTGKLYWHEAQIILDHINGVKNLPRNDWSFE